MNCVMVQEFEPLEALNCSETWMVWEVVKSMVVGSRKTNSSALLEACKLW